VGLEHDDWKQRYSRRVTDAASAVRTIGRGHHVFIGSGAAEPQALVAAMCERGNELSDTELIHILTLGIAPYSDCRFVGSFRHNALFIGANVRGAVAAGRADYTPVFLSEIPRLFRSRRLALDVALIQVGPPDDHGFCSFGVSVDVVKSAAECADLVLAEVNSRMPRTLGDSFIHVSQINKLVPVDAPLPESLPPDPDEVAVEIGRHVAQLVDNGSTIQVGIGMIPNAVLRHLHGKKDLGVHTEMFSDGVIDLIESGTINCSKKTLLPGKAVTSFCMGTRRLYDYVHDNPLFEFRGVEFTNDPLQIAANKKMVAINAALEIDLTGQVCADSIGVSFHSGIGGQVDFIRGAARSEGGKPIIAMRSTAKGDAVSRIVPHLKEGAGVVTSRGDVHFVVTEYGVADLWGRSVRDRALALISVAHPKFREELLADAKRHHLLYDDQMLPAADYPDEWETVGVLRDGGSLVIRPVRATDERLLRDMFYDCSEETIHSRFFKSVKAAPHPKLQRWVNVDYTHEMALGGFVQDGEVERLVGMGHYIVDPATGLGEIDFMVQDAYQNRGVGTLLLQHLMKVARARGLKGFTADVLAQNTRMLHLLHKSGREMKSTLEERVYHLEFRLG